MSGQESLNAFPPPPPFAAVLSQRESKTHMPTLNEITASADHLHEYSCMIGALHGEFWRRFEDIKIIENEMHMISSPFIYNVENTPSDAQLKLIDLQALSVLAEHFKSEQLLEFCSSLKEENFPNKHTQRMLVLFYQPYICEQTPQTFSLTLTRLLKLNRD